MSMWLTRLEKTRHFLGCCIASIGKKIPAAVVVSLKGSITSKIRAAALNTLDNRGVFQRTSRDPIQCVLFGAHDTLLQVEYLVRVNCRIIHDNPAWMLSIDLPNGTSI